MAIFESAESEEIGPKVPEMNSNGKSTKLMMAGAASSFGTNVETASPSALKQNAPVTTATASPR